MAIAEVTGQRAVAAPAGTGSTVVVTYPGSPTSGNLIVACLSFLGATMVTPPTGWTQLGTTLIASSVRYEIWYKVAGGGEPTTYTFTLSGSASARSYSACEFSGMTTPTPDKFSSNAGASGTSLTTGLTGTLTNAAEAVAGMFSVTAGKTVSAHDNGATEIGEASNSSVDASGFTKVTSANTSTNFGATASAGGAWAAVVGTFYDAGGTNYTMPASTGTYTRTGTAATLLYNRKVVAAAGALAITGVAATLRKGRTLVAAAGAIVLSGKTATFLRTYRMPAAARAFTLTGAAVDFIIVYPAILVAEAGAYAITGLKAVMRRYRLPTPIGGSGSSGATPIGGSGSVPPTIINGGAAPPPDEVP